MLDGERKGGQVVAKNGPTKTDEGEATRRVELSKGWGWR